MLKITEKQKIKVEKYFKATNNDFFDFVIEDLEKQLEIERKKTHRINDNMEMFRLNHTLNGFENCINYIKTQKKIYEDYADGKVIVRKQENDNE